MLSFPDGLFIRFFVIDHLLRQISFTPLPLSISRYVHTAMQGYFIMIDDACLKQ